MAGETNLGVVSIRAAQCGIEGHLSRASQDESETLSIVSAGQSSEGSLRGDHLEARDLVIPSSSTLAGSSLGSCGTSLPSNARLRIAWRSRLALAKPAETARSAAPTRERRRSTSAIIPC